jgi:hypothetical protein
MLCLDNLAMMLNGIFMSKAEFQFEKCYLEFLKIVVNHSPQEDLLFSFGKGLKKIASDLGGDIRINQGSEDMPLEIPRVMIQAKDMYVNFGLNRMEVGIKGSRKHVRNDELLSNYKHRIKEIELLILSYLQETGAKENFIGMVAPVRFPQDLSISNESLVNMLYEMLTGKRNSELASFSFKFSRITDGFYENYEVSDYEIKNVKVAPSSITPSLINIDEHPTVDKGVLIVVDVNNKPQPNYHFSTDYINVSTHFFNTIKNCKKMLKEEYYK